VGASLGIMVAFAIINIDAIDAVGVYNCEVVWCRFQVGTKMARSMSKLNTKANVGQCH
jgi:hypothetical protein